MDNYYSMRADAWINNCIVRRGEIIRVFKSGFDAKFDNDFIFFSLEEDNLHPCSVFIQLDNIDDIHEGSKITFGKTLTIAAIAETISEKCWVCGTPVSAIEKPMNILQNAIATNMTLLEKNLKLFGKKSVLNTFMESNGSPKEDTFQKIQRELSSKKLNLENFVEIIGVGEGLTPSVDDFFTGMLLVDRISGNNYITASEHFFSVCSKKTTRQSVLQLKFAEKGLLSLRFERFFTEFVSDAIKSAEIVKLLNYGHTSGTDILKGLLFYIKNVSNFDVPNVI